MEKQSAKAFVFYNIAPFAPGKEQELARDMEDYVAKTGNEIVLYSLTLHPQGLPAMEKANFLIDSYRKLRQELSGSAVKLGVLLQSLIGHWPRVDKNEESWTRTVNCDGEIVRFCPLDPNYRNYIFTIVQLLAKEDPVFVMTDDDVRWFSPKAECFCPLHTAEFNKRMHTNLTSDEYRKLIGASHVGDENYTAFIQLQRDTVSGLGALVREAINTVNPEIPGGSCMPGWDYRFAREIARAVAGKHPAVLRVANAMYCEKSAKDLPINVLHTQALKQYQEEFIPRILDEADTYPHNLYSRSAKSMHAKLCTSIMSGLNGAKIWFVNAHKQGLPVSKNYTRILAENQGLYQTLTREIQTAQPTGVVVPLHKKFTKWHPFAPKEHFLDENSWGEMMCGAFGVPMRGSFKLDEEAVYTLAGAKSVERFSDDDLKQLLSRKILLDGAAAAAITDRGLAEYLGLRAERTPYKYTVEANPETKQRYFVFTSEAAPLLTITDPAVEILTQCYYEPYSMKGLTEPVAPATVFYRNSLGGHLCVTVNSPGKYQDHMLSPARKCWFRQILARLNGESLPYVVVGDQDLLALSVKTRENATILGITNMNFDPLNPLQIHCAKEPAAVEVLQGNGTWKSQTFTFQQEILSLPLNLECYDCVFLKIHEE